MKFRKYSVSVAVLLALTGVMSACVVTQPTPSNTTTASEPKTETPKPAEPEKADAKPETPSANTWTAEQKTKEVDSCIASANASLKANNRTADASKVSNYCNCVIDKAEAKYSYEEANRNASKVIQELSSSGVIEACIESAGLKE